MKTLLASLALSLAAWSAALCGGSLSTEEALQPLKAAPVLWKYVDKTLNLSDTAWGTRCGHHWGFLGGQRIGPYSITITPDSPSAEDNQTQKVVHPQPTPSPTTR
ncbi:MAG: hypothetical protein BGO12_23360 [Verrucomicrobia bacterium 61-8]|nr:hypothetical protein [Verrucomicrobiota bacterium]OJV14004.1 MAG: hypothetical protein BGO12_23360 [Verrucomicrobia bacterium 61-8]